MSKQPLILTLRLDQEHQKHFDEIRKKYFPPERNFLNAHLSLFHQLPNNDVTIKVIKEINQCDFYIKVVGLKFLGAGVAYAVESDKLIVLHKQLSYSFNDVLMPQDRQGYRPHITIQNKVEPQKAKLLFNQLNQNFEAFTAKGIGLDLWVYLNGPWEHHSYYPSLAFNSQFLLKQSC